MGDDVTVAAVRLWGQRIGAVSVDAPGAVAAFQYDPAFVGTGVQPAPLRMPAGVAAYRFPALIPESFRGLPGMLADALPDLFGNALIDAWLARQGRRPESFDVVERLCYIGTRGMGALEFEPAAGPAPSSARNLEVSELVALASEVLAARDDLDTTLAGGHEIDGLADILAVGTSAGGQRAKAVIAFNGDTGEVRSGQVPAPPGFAQWLLKFDGVSGSTQEFGGAEGYGAIEYAYSLMAGAAGVTMTPCRLLEEGGRRHFMTRRFDRPDDGTKLHMQSLAALCHYDFRLDGAYSYEQALLAALDLGLSHRAVEQLFRRMVFNIVARNQDDHVKNIAFLMNEHGAWALSPAFDVTYAYNPSGRWTSRHQMTVNGKRDTFTLADLRACAEVGRLKRTDPARILAEVVDAVSRWERFADQAGVTAADAEAVARTFRRALPNG
jgi:serine/threonine-protein kinase HipA